jgi:uncharacterized protein YggE
VIGAVDRSGRGLVVRLVMVGAAPVLGLAPLVQAQPSAQGPPTISVTGHAVEMVAPDQAEIDVGVVTRAETSREASTRNVREAERVVERLRGVVGGGAMVRSVTYSIRPEYSVPGNGREPTITGYTATNVVRVTMPDVTKVGHVIDAATSAGANRIDRIRFSLREEADVRAKALAGAARTARAQAEALASALGVRIVRVLAASDASPPVRPFADVQRLAAGSAATPIEAGPIEVSAAVNLTVEVSAAPPP